MFLAVLALAALFGPVLPIPDPQSGQLEEALRGPSVDHWLGTDNLGRDVFSRLIFGARTSLLAGIEVVLIALVIGVPTGLLAGYHGGRIDRIAMRVVEVFATLPVLVVAMAVVAATGPGIVTSMLAVGVVAATIMARFTRAVVTAAREEDYIDAARITGAPDREIVVRHLLPNIAPALVVQASLLIAAAVLAEASLSFLGLGAVAPEPSWGVMLSQARDQFDDAPWLTIWPGLCITLTVLAFSRLGDRSQDVSIDEQVVPLDVEPITPVEWQADRKAATASARTPALGLVGLSAVYGETDVVSDVSLSVADGEIVGLVGESGAGKSTLGLASLGLVPPPGRVRARSITVAGVELVGMPPHQLRHVRGRLIGHVSQEPAAALNPVYTVGHQMAEPLRWHLDRSSRQARLEVAEWLDRVGIPPERSDEYPHQFSGGELQRIALAMALSCHPAMLIADEPTTALDTVTQSQLLDLLLELCVTLGTAVLLISHDLGVVAGVADRTAVMHRGRIVECGRTDELSATPRDLYTRQLLASSRDVRSRVTGSPAGGGPTALGVRAE